MLVYTDLLTGKLTSLSHSLYQSPLCIFDSIMAYPDFDIISFEFEFR